MVVYLLVIPELKLFLNALRAESNAFMQSVGFNMRHSSYEKTFSLLDNHYSRERNIFVKTQKFILVSHLAAKMTEITF